MKKHNKKGSIFTVLLTNYIIFTLILILSLLGCIIFFFNLTNNDAYLNKNNISDYNNLLKNEQYDELPLKDIVGKNGTIIILDNKGKNIYNPNNLNFDLNLEDISFIIPSDSDYTITTSVLKNKDSKLNYQITYNDYKNNSEVYILNENYSLIYGSGSKINGTLTEKQYKLLSNSYFENFEAKKYQFLTNENNKYTLLLLKNINDIDDFWNKIGSNLQFTLLLFYIIYTILILVLIYWLKKKISKPLNVLCEEFKNFNIHEEKNINEYKGPREFVELFENFKNMTERLEKSENEKMNLIEDKQKTITNIAHDLKTPIAVINGYTKALVDGLIKPEDIKKYLTIIGEKSIKLDELINMLFEFSKLNNSDFKLDTTKTNICDFMRNYLINKYDEFLIKDFNLDVNIPEQTIFCQIDYKQLSRAFDNIINNCLTYNNPHTTFKCIILNEENHIKIIFEDNGIGIKEENRQEIFKPFVSGDSSRNHQGSGLGLAITKQIIELHNGTITLLEPDSIWKTVFEIILPITNI